VAQPVALVAALRWLSMAAQPAERAPPEGPLEARIREVRPTVAQAARAAGQRVPRVAAVMPAPAIKLDQGSDR
jgi:hypothetical protein